MQRRQNSYRQASTGSLRTAPPDPHSGGTWARLSAPWEVRLFFQSYSDVILRMVEIECAGQTVMPVLLGLGLWPVSSQNDLHLICINARAFRSAIIPLSEVGTRPKASCVRRTRGL